MKFHKLYIAAIGAASMAMAGCELDIVNSDQLNTTTCGWTKAMSRRDDG